MAKKIDPRNLTLDYKQLLGIPVQDRISLFQSGGQSYFESLTPEQLSRLFPKYYQRQLPDIGKAVSGGTAGVAPPTAGAGAERRGITSGALGRAARSEQAPGQPSSAIRTTPAPSTTTQENFFNHIMSLAGKKPSQQQSTSGEQRSFNTLAGQHLNGGTPFRKNYAGIGYTYDAVRDAFIPPKPFESWILNEETCQWNPPKPMPKDASFDNPYFWDEETVNWVKPTV